MFKGLFYKKTCKVTVVLHIKFVAAVENVQKDVTDCHSATCDEKTDNDQV